MKDEIFELLKEYCASKLNQVENLLEGDNIMIVDLEWSDFDEDLIVFTNVGKYQINKISKSDFSAEYLKNHYSHYVIAEYHNDNVRILQSLNYEKLDSSYSFQEAIGWKFFQLELRIKNALDDLIRCSINREHLNLKGILALVIKEISIASNNISSNIQRNNGEYKYPIYSGQNSRKMITEAMKFIAERQTKFINDLQKEYQHYTPNLLEKKRLEENLMPQIFANDFGYTLFRKLHEIYKDNQATEANYSFIWYALEKEELIICRQRKYLDYLSSLNVYLPKINSIQKNENNRKWATFKSIKTSIEE